MAENDYSVATDYLEQAYAAAPYHRGIKKSLGYCYVWLGLYSEAATLLRDIPEAGEEIKTYIWWWQTQSQEDLSYRAQQMVNYFESLETQP